MTWFYSVAQAVLQQFAMNVSGDVIDVIRGKPLPEGRHGGSGAPRKRHFRGTVR
jgi:hypothetical protein